MCGPRPKVPARIAEQMPNVMIPQWHRGRTGRPVPRHDRFSGYGSGFARRALEAAGVRVVEIRGDMVDPREWDRAAVEREVTATLERL